MKRNISFAFNFNKYSKFNMYCNKFNVRRISERESEVKKKKCINLDKNPHDNAKAATESKREITRGDKIKDSRVCFAVFVRAALDANPQAGILGGGTQLGNNRCQ